MLGIQDGGFSRSLVIQQTRRTLRVEPDHPVANDLKANATKPRRLRPRPAIVDRRERQKPPHLIAIPAVPRQPSQIVTREIASNLDRRRHGKPPPFSMLNQFRALLGIWRVL